MRFKVATKGHGDTLDITDNVEMLIKSAGIKDGIALIFVAGSTAAITTIEYEQGVIEDLRDILEKIVPEAANYKHHLRWGDRNGAAHIRSAMMGTSFTVPIEDNRLVLGTWQQIVLIDFDERPRQREVFVKVIASLA